MTYHALYAITTESTVGSDGLRQFGHLVTIGAKVAREVVLEIADMPAITYIQLNTLVLYLTGIDPIPLFSTSPALIHWPLPSPITPMPGIYTRISFVFLKYHSSEP